AVTQFREELAGSHNNLGIVLTETGRKSESEAEFRKAIAIKQKLADDNPAVTQFRYGLAVSRFQLGVPLLGRPEAEAEVPQPIALSQTRADADPADIRFRRILGLSHFNLGSTLSSMGKLTEAEAECRAAVTILGNVVDDDPKVWHHRHDLTLA